MDLGIKGKRALVCGASSGLGLACAQQLAAEGVVLAMVARRESQLEESATGIRDTHGIVPITISADVTTQEGMNKLLMEFPDPDILINNAGGPPPGDFRNWDRDDWFRALEQNMVSPILLIKAVIDGMVERQWGRIINITSGGVKAPIPTLGLSNGARSGLTGFIGGLARQVAHQNVTINNVLPGAFDTPRLAQTLSGMAKSKGISMEEAKSARLAGIPSQRFGKPSEFGATCVFLCSDQAGYITAQNILSDGGAYPGTI